MNYFNLTGLILNLAGALLLAFSTKVVDISKSSHGVSIKIVGRNLTITTINKKLFIPGIIGLIVGFILQLIGMFYG